MTESTKPAALVIEIGNALYGAEWQTDMSRAITVSDRTVRRWAAGTSSPSAGVYADLVRIMLDRQAALDDLIERARRHPDPFRPRLGAPAEGQP